MSLWQSTVDMLEVCMAKLQDQVPLNDVKDLRQFLPPVPDGCYRLILVELIKFDLASAAEVGLERRLSDYLVEFANEIPDAEVPPDLVLEELQILGESGVEVDLKIYRERFPHLVPVLNQWHDNGLNPVQTIKPLGLAPHAVPELAIGQSIEDFRILRCVGRGGFASVYLALQETLQRLVALKVSQRSSEESQTLSQLDHPNIVRVFDERNPRDPPVRLLYMQFVGGGTMADCLKRLAEVPRLDRRGSHLMAVISLHLEQYGLEPASQSNSVGILNRLDWPATVAWVGSQLSEGLDYAHRQSVIHRDIKPANILFAADGTPRLADFNVSYSGIAGRAGAAAYFGGSLAYMSPEQIEISLSTDGKRKAEELDGRSDLFSLGVVLWEMLHDSRPWSQVSRPTSWTEALKNELAARHCLRAERPDRCQMDHNPSFRVLQHAINACLNLDPIRRPPNGQTLKKMLRLALHPRAAQRVFPRHQGILKRIARLPPSLVLTLGALVPNLVAAIFNFLYNSSQIVGKYPDLWSTFLRVATWVNILFFPIGVVLTSYLIVKHSRSLTGSMAEFLTTTNTKENSSPALPLENPPSFGWYPAVSRNLPLTPGDPENVQSLHNTDRTAIVTDHQELKSIPPSEQNRIGERGSCVSLSPAIDPAPVIAEKSSETFPPGVPNPQTMLADPPQTSSPKNEFAWNLGHHVALICGVLWLVAGLVFPVLLLITHHSFRWGDALHFFSSLTICGGVAMVYPFYWITCLNLTLYYPLTVAERLNDPGVLVWGSRLRRLARGYLISAAAIPLIALLLLVTAVDVPRFYLIMTILTTAAGFAASLFAVQYIDDFVQDLEPAISEVDGLD